MPPWPTACPPEIVYAIAYQESGWRQFNDDGTPLNSVDGYGTGIMQVSFGSCVNYPSYKCYDTGSLQNDIDYNINAGVEILVDKLHTREVDGQTIGGSSNLTNVYENWFYAVWSYNSWVAGNGDPSSGYPYLIWGLINSGGNGWWTSLPVTAPPQQPWPPPAIPTPQPQHTWLTPNNFFPWYDNVSAANWLMMANPGTSPAISFSVAVGGAAENPGSLPGQPAGVVPPGSTLAARYPGLMDGPVGVGSSDAAGAMVSQRTLWAGNSLEEVPGTQAADLSSHYYWTWYDMLSPRFKNWVLVANPSPSDFVSFQVRIAGETVSSGVLAPGESVTPTFPGTMGGPVEVIASGNVIASQRVLSGAGTAFNEVLGTRAADLSSDYLWTWYDMRDAGATDWILIGNPSLPSDPGSYPIYYEIWIDGQPVADGGPVAPGANAAPLFPGTMGGPVEVKTFSDPQHQNPVNSVASQRIIWGPSFEEVPGYPGGALKSAYNWTWYDMQSPGSANWVLISNTNQNAVNYQIAIAGQIMASGTLQPGQTVTPTFPGVMNGPVQVTSSGGPVLASQRVLWSGHLNEVLGSG